MPPERPSQPLVHVGLLEEPLGVREFLLILTRAAAVLGGTLLVYFLLPVDERSPTLWILIVAAVGMLLVLVVFFRQFGRIERAPRPGAAAIEALVLVVGMFLTLFALMYVTISTTDPDSFTEPIDKVAGIYFSVTILSTVGYGDIAPTSDWTRILVTVQMLLDIVLIGAAVKLFGLQVKKVRSKRSSHHSSAHRSEE